MAPATEPVRVWLRRAQLRWIGHLVRREGSYAPKIMLFAHAIRQAEQPARLAGRPPMSYLEQMHNMIRRLSRPGGALDRVIQVSRQFGVQFTGLAGNSLPDRHCIDWTHVAMNRVLWACVVSMGAMDC